MQVDVAVALFFVFIFSIVTWICAFRSLMAASSSANDWVSVATPPAIRTAAFAALPFTPLISIAEKWQ